MSNFEYILTELDTVGMDSSDLVDALANSDFSHVEEIMHTFISIKGTKEFFNVEHMLGLLRMWIDSDTKAKLEQSNNLLPNVALIVETSSKIMKMFENGIIDKDIYESMFVYAADRVLRQKGNA